MTDENLFWLMITRCAWINKQTGFIYFFMTSSGPEDPEGTHRVLITIEKDGKEGFVGDPFWDTEKNETGEYLIIGDHKYGILEVNQSVVPSQMRLLDDQGREILFVSHS